VCGCASSFNRKVFQFEKTTTDGVEAAAQSFRAYYHAKTNGLPAVQIQKLNFQLRAVGVHRANVAVAIDLVDDLRLAYKTNKSDSVYTNILNGMRIANSQASNIVWVVRF
jgi:hypothetical protein